MFMDHQFGCNKILSRTFSLAGFTFHNRVTGSSSSSTHFIEHDISWKLGPSSGIRPSCLNPRPVQKAWTYTGEGPSFRVETSCSIKTIAGRRTVTT